MSNFTEEETVQKAILSLLVKGSNPSIDNIRSELAIMFGYDEKNKKGSPNEVLRIKKAWQEQLAAQLDSLEVPMPETAPPEAAKIFRQMWELCLDVATEKFNENQEAFASKEQELTEKIKHLEQTIETNLATQNMLENQVGSLNKKLDEAALLQEAFDAMKDEKEAMYHNIIKLEARALIAEEQKNTFEKSYTVLVESNKELMLQFKEVNTKLISIAMKSK